MKSEPDECSIDDLAAAAKQTLPWTGVRNYQARNFMRDQFRLGDGVLFYHSSCPEPGIAGLAEVASTAAPDETQFDPKSPYFDAAATREAPRWIGVDVKLVRKTALLPLAEMRAAPQLATMRVLQRGNRLSITPVSPAEWKAVLALLRPA
jgi:predicted RNA-binding protein with PUA-like domain